MKRKKENKEDKTIMDSAELAEKKSKKEDLVQETEINEVPIADRCLDKLARLFQQTSKGCAAVSIINQTLLIADNGISEGSFMEGKKVSGKIKLIRTVMQYFSDFANKKEKFIKSREEVFKEICMERLQGEEQGYIKLEDNVLETIAKDVLNTYKKIESQKNWREIYIEKIKSYTPYQKPFVALAYEMAALLARDFLKIEKFIMALNNAETDLVAAFKGKENQRIFIDQAGGILEGTQGQVQEETDPGYIILNIDFTGVHAEAKIIEYLIFTGVISNLEKGEKIYIGISKLCCKGCNKFVKAINKIFCSSSESSIEIIKIRGAHDLQPEWVQPVICYDNFKERQKEYIYMASPKQITQLNKLVPNLKHVNEQQQHKVYQTEFSSSSPLTQSPKNKQEKEQLNELSKVHDFQILQEFLSRFADLLPGETNELIIKSLSAKIGNDKELEKSLDQGKTKSNVIDTTWYDFLAIKEGLANKKIDVKHILQSVVSRDELNKRLDEVIEANSFYIIPLNVNALDGSFTATNHWVGLHITTNMEGKVSSIKYINPIGQQINESLAKEVFEKTRIKTLDLTIGNGPQCAFEKDNQIELKGNINDCGPMLVQLLFELVNKGKICTPSLSEAESAEFGQWCREDQKSKNENLPMEDLAKQSIVSEVVILAEHPEAYDS